MAFDTNLLEPVGTKSGFDTSLLEPLEAPAAKEADYSVESPNVRQLSPAAFLGTVAHATGRALFAGGVDLMSELIGQRRREVRRAERRGEDVPPTNVEQLFAGEPVSAEIQKKFLPPSLQVAQSAGEGLIKTIPQLAAVTALQAGGVPAPVGAGLVFGSTPEGFDVAQGAIAASLPFVGKYSGELAGLVARRFGVEGATAMNWIKGFAGLTGPAAELAALQEADIRKLPKDQQHEARLEMTGNIVGMLALGPMGVKFEQVKKPSRFKLTDHSDTIAELALKEEANRQVEAGSPFTRRAAPVEPINAGLPVAPAEFDPSGLNVLPRTTPVQEPQPAGTISAGDQLRAMIHQSEPVLEASPSELLRSRIAAENAVESGSPFAQSRVPVSPVNPGLPLVTANFPPSGLNLVQPQVAPAVQAGGIPAGESLRGMLTVPPAPSLQAPPSNLAPEYNSGRAAQRLRELAADAQRKAQFEAARAEQVSQEQEVPVHGYKPLTANQLKLMREDLRHALDANPFREKPAPVYETPARPDEPPPEATGGVTVEKQPPKPPGAPAAPALDKAGRLEQLKAADAEGMLNAKDKAELDALAEEAKARQTAKDVFKKSAKPTPVTPATKVGGLISGSKLEAWADKQLKGKLLSPTPTDLAALVIKGAAILERGITDFARWSSEMMKAHGPAIRSKLRQIYDESVKLRAGAFDKKDEPVAPKETATEAAVGTTVVPAKTAAAMEKKVKLPAEQNVAKLQDQLNLFNQEIGEALTSGGRFLPKDMRPDVAKGLPAEPGTVTNRAINQHFVDKLVTIRKEFNKAIAELMVQADPASIEYARMLRERFEVAFRQVQELRRASHESLYFWNKIKAEYQQIAQAAGEFPEIKKRLPILNQIYKDFKDGEYQQGLRDIVDGLRVNRFTPGSWTLDFLTNATAAVTRIPTWAVMDVAHLVSGKPAYRMATALRSLMHNAENWIPFKTRFRLPEQIETELGTVAGGEFGGLPKEVMLGFDTIIKDNPALAKKLNNFDYVLGGPVRMKRAVDNFFGRFGAAADLYNRAYTEGRRKKLTGDDLKQFVEEFVANPPANAITEAVKTGKELKFNRDLSTFEERFSASMGVKLFVEAYPRWTFQFMRWGAEMIGADPVMYKKMATRKATPEETINFFVKAATGWGAIYAFNNLFYDDIDANSMEYISENGDRTRLSGRTPAPELFFVSAILRGDWDKAKASLSQLSLPGAKLLGGEPSGVLSNVIDVFRESVRGRYTAEQTARELTNLVNDLIPGKSMLGLIRAMFDPTVREGIGSPIPGVSQLLPQRINPTTGEPLAPRQRIPGTKIEIPTVAGTPFPGAVRVLNDIEKSLLNHGFILSRPRRTSIIDLPAEEVPKSVRTEYEKRVGKNIKQIVGEGIESRDWKAAPFDVRREILSRWIAAARIIARAEMAELHGTSMKQKKSEPMNVERMPERLKK